MIIFLGLGNPGKKYSGTRHNIGFTVLDRFQKEKDFPFFTRSGKSLSSQKDDITLIKPLTFMNNSGLALKNKRFDQLVVIHDDLDLKLGEIKISENRGAGGHKGIESIINEIKTKDFIRIRIGISPDKKPTNGKEFVLKKFRFLEKKSAKKTTEEAVLILDSLIDQGLKKTMNKYN